MIEKLNEYYNGHLSDEEALEMEKWINESPDNKEVAERVFYICFAADTLKEAKRIDTDYALRKVHQRMSGHKRSFVHSFQRIAAVLFLPLLLTSIYFATRPKQAEEFVQMLEVRTTPGMMSSFYLPDSSKVWLNSNSVLKYPARFGKERNVELVGEAYFDVTKDEAHKFNVQTKAMTIEVVGTEFNVDAYENRQIITTLISGAINMHYEDTTNTKQMLRVYPNQTVVLNPKNKAITVSKANPSTVSAWRMGKIVLENTPFEETLRYIENKFNVQFIVKNPKLYSLSYTGQFTDQRLESVLNHFSKSAKIRFKYLDNNTIEVY